MKSAAQQKKLLAAKAAAAPAAKKSQTVTLTVTVEEGNNILAALGELPAKFSMALIGKIQQQASQQLKAAQGAGG